MPFITNVSYSNFRDGNHINPGNAIAIQILSPDRNDFGYEGSEVPFPTSPYKYISNHYFLIDDSIEGDVITDAQAIEIIKILEDALASNYNVICHCAAGVSRSGAITEFGVLIGFQDLKCLRMPNPTIKNKLKQLWISRKA
jgi:hypothetical protein